MSAAKKVTASKAAKHRQFKAFDSMVRDQRLNGTDLRVAWRIIDRMNVECRSNPGHQLISNEIGCTRQTVLRSTARLEAFGYFDVTKGGGKGKSHYYALTMETVRDDGQYERKPRSAESVRGLTRGCPSPYAKGVRGDGQESLIEPKKESPWGEERVASPPECGARLSKEKKCLHGETTRKSSSSLPPMLPGPKARDGSNKAEKSAAYARSKLADALGWGVMLAADEVANVNHLSAVETCRREAKRLGVNWNPPDTSAVREPVIHPARLQPCLEALQAKGFTPDVALGAIGGTRPVAA